MQRQKVVRVNVARAHAAIVAIGAVALGVAAGTELRVVGRHELVTLQETSVVPRIEQPVRGLESPFGKLGAHAPGSVLEVTRRALARGITSRGLGHLVTVETAAHARELIASGKLDSIDLAVALRAADVAPAVRLMRELEVRRGETLASHAVAVLRLVTDVAVAALTDEVRREALDSAELAVVALVTPVARRGFWQERVPTGAARRGVDMAIVALEAEIVNVESMVEPDRDCLHGKHHGARPAVVRKGAWGAVAQRHHRSLRQRREPVHSGRPPWVARARGLGQR
jgi:hypothetical protein